MLIFVKDVVKYVKDVVKYVFSFGWLVEKEHFRANLNPGSGIANRRGCYITQAWKVLKMTNSLIYWAHLIKL
jgi:hypothetical protein